MTRSLIVTTGCIAILLLTGCATASSPTTASNASKVAVGAPPATPRTPYAAEGDEDGDNATDFVPSIQVGETREGTIYEQDTGQEGTWTLTLERSHAPFWVAAAWGRDYALTLTTDTMGFFRFRDAAGDEYSLWVHVTNDEHTLYYNSQAPEITGLTQTG